MTYLYQIVANMYKTRNEQIIKKTIEMEISRYCKFSTFCKYLIPRSRCILSNRENIESRMRNIIHISYSSQLLRNSGDVLHFREECFSLIYAEIKKTLAYK